MILRLLGKTIRVQDGWQHDPYSVNYRISTAQAKRHKLEAADIPRASGIRLYVVRDPPAEECPHCQTPLGDVFQVIAH